MARLVPTILLLSLAISGGAQAADPSGSPWHIDPKARPSRSFDLPDQLSNFRAERGPGSRILAGRELMPNGMLGFGLFGQKAEKGPHAPATAREFALPKSRKAAVGFSLRF